MRTSFWRSTFNRILRGIGASLALGLAALAVLVVIINQQADRAELRNVDALLVMGAAQWNGTPSPMFGARLDEALRLYRMGYAPRIIVTGGTAPGDSQSEAAVARDYLVDHTVDPTVITVVAQGTDTRTTLEAVARQSQADGVRSVLLVSDPPHMLRALKIARDYGLEAFAAPVEANRPLGAGASLRTTLHEAWGYLGYIFLGQ
ncbi:MAG TPA: YdcF family protein [Herpetosiphonaceae bacterium]